jgi:predicted nucleic acid-binding protein
MSTPALICDTGALVDYLAPQAADHRGFRHAIEEARARYVPALVLAELDYFLRDDRATMRAFMQDLAIGAFTFAAVTLELLNRAMEIDRAYADLELGLVDASVVALAEQIGVVRIATRDVRDFAAVRLRGGRGLELVQPSRLPR